MKDHLDSDGKPVLKQEYVGNWHSFEEFNQWYRNTPEVNIPFTVNLTFENSVSNPDMYSYKSRYKKNEANLTSSQFFPITGEGYGNYYNDENFHFTTELKARFVYNGGVKIQKLV